MKKRIPLGIAALALIGACSQEADTLVLAESEGDLLTTTQVAAQIPSGLSKKDSTVLAQRIITDWILRKKWLALAEDNLGNDLDSFELSVQQYREDLLILSYKNRFASERVDTSMDESVLRALYDQFKNELKLSETVVRASFLVIPESTKRWEQHKKALTQNTIEPNKQLVAFASKHARLQRLGDTTWTRLEDVMNAMGVPAYNEENVAKAGITTWSDGNSRFIVCFHAVRKAQQTSPYALVRPALKNILFERKKKELFRSVEAEMISDKE